MLSRPINAPPGLAPSPNAGAAKAAAVAVWNAGKGLPKLTPEPK